MLTSVFDATNRRSYEEELLLARRRAEDARERLAAMQRVSVRIALSTGVHQTAGVAARSAVELVGAAVAATWLVGDDPNRLVLRSRAAAPDVERPDDSSVPSADDGRAGWATVPSELLAAEGEHVVLPWERVLLDAPGLTERLRLAPSPLGRERRASSSSASCGTASAR